MSALGMMAGSLMNAILDRHNLHRQGITRRVSRGCRSKARHRDELSRMPASTPEVAKAVFEAARRLTRSCYSPAARPAGPHGRWRRAAGEVPVAGGEEAAGQGLSGARPAGQWPVGSCRACEPARQLWKNPVTPLWKSAAFGTHTSRPLTVTLPDRSPFQRIPTLPPHNLKDSP